MKRILLILTTLHFVLRRWRSKPLPPRRRSSVYLHQDKDGTPFNVPEGMTVMVIIPSIVDAYRHPSSPRARLTLPVAPHANHLRLN